MRTKTFVITLLVLTTLFLTMLFAFSEQENFLNKYIDKEKLTFDRKKTPTDNQGIDSLGTSTATSSSSTTSGTNDVVGGSSGGVNCEKLQISYSFTNIQSSSNCKTYSGPICIEKSLFCSVLVNNLDSSTSGDFTISFLYYHSNNRENIVITDTQTTNISSKGSATLSSTTTILDENADKEIFCMVRSVTIPTKTDC
jgi:hypothetical protein